MTAFGSCGNRPELGLVAAGQRGVGAHHPAGHVGTHVNGSDQIPRDGLRSIQGGCTLRGRAGHPRRRPKARRRPSERCEPTALPIRCATSRAASSSGASASPDPVSACAEHPPHDAGGRSERQRAAVPGRQSVANAVFQSQLCRSHREVSARWGWRFRSQADRPCPPPTAHRQMRTRSLDRHSNTAHRCPRSDAVGGRRLAVSCRRRAPLGPLRATALQTVS